MATINTDSRKHFNACLIIAALTAFVLLPWHFTALQIMAVAVMVAVAVGVGKEYGDSKAPGNYFDWVDLAFDALGAIIGAQMAWFNLLID